MNQNQVIDAIGEVAGKVLRVNLGIGSIPSEAEQGNYDIQVRAAVVEVIKHHKHDMGLIENLAAWPPILQQTDERGRLTFIATVLAIYDR